MNNLFSTLGEIAGLAGLIVGFLLIIFRSIIQKKIFQSLTKKQSYNIIRLIIILSFIIGLVGIIGWLSLQGRSKHDDNIVKPVLNKDSLREDSIKHMYQKAINEITNVLNPSVNTSKLKIILTLTGHKISENLIIDKSTNLGSFKSMIIAKFNLISDLNEMNKNCAKLISNWYLFAGSDSIKKADEKKSFEEYGIRENTSMSIGCIFTCDITPYSLTYQDTNLKITFPKKVIPSGIIKQLMENRAKTNGTQKRKIGSPDSAIHSNQHIVNRKDLKTTVIKK